MSQAEQAGVLDQIGAVARMIVIVDADADVVEQGRRPQQHSVPGVQAVQGGPAVEQLQGDVGDMKGVLLVHLVKPQHIHRAVTQDIRNHVGIIFMAQIMPEKQAFPDAAAADDEVRGANPVEQALHHGDAGDDDVASLAAQSAHAPALHQIGAGDETKQIFEGDRAHPVIVDLGKRVIFAGLVHLGDVTGRAADSDQRQRQRLQPGSFLQLAVDEAAQMRQIGFGNFVVGFELVAEIDGADRQADALDQTPVPDQGNFCAAAAEVEQDRVFDVDGVDRSQIAEKRFGFTADRLDGQAGFPGGHIQKLGTIAGVADRGGRHGQNGVGFHDVAHLGEIPQSGQ